MGPDVEKGALEYLSGAASLISSPCFCLAATSQISANRIRLGSDCLNTQKTCCGERGSFRPSDAPAEVSRQPNRIVVFVPTEEQK